MAIGFDVSACEMANNVTSLATDAFTVGTGSDRMMFVLVGTKNGVTVSSIEWNGQTGFTQVGGYSDHTSGYRTSIWWLAAPDSGSGTVTVSFSGKTLAFISAAAFTGVHQTSPIDCNGGSSGTGTSASASCTVATANCWGLGIVYVPSNIDITEDGDAVLICNFTSGGHKGQTSRDETVATDSWTISWTLASSVDWVCKIAAFKPSVVAPPSGTIYLVKTTGRRTQLSAGAEPIKVDTATGKRGLQTGFDKYLVKEDDGRYTAKSA